MISKISHNGVEVAPNVSYSDIGIVDRSVITVDVCSEVRFLCFFNVLRILKHLERQTH